VAREDAAIQRDVIAELALDPAVGPLEIGVAVRGGVVTLSGAVDGEARKAAVLAATRRVDDITAIAEELRVLGPGINRTDTELAHAVVQALRWERTVPLGVTARVDEGCVWLEGAVDSVEERKAAERAVRFVAGVKDVKNEVTLRMPLAASGPPRRA
jgi:osmotically-inducible protein OsmY